MRLFNRVAIWTSGVLTFVSLMLFIALVLVWAFTGNDDAANASWVFVFATPILFGVTAFLYDTLGRNY